MNIGTRLIIITIAILLISTIFLSGCTESGKEGFGKDDCKKDCIKTESQFFKYDHSYGGYGPNLTECWCMNSEKEVQQIW